MVQEGARVVLVAAAIALLAPASASATADIQVTATSSSTSVSEDDSTAYQHHFVFHNAGPDSATGTAHVTTGPFPFTSIGSAGGTLDASNPFDIVVGFSGLPATQDVTLDLGFVPAHPGVQRTSAAVTTTTVDPDPSSDSGAAATTVNGLRVTDAQFGDVLLGAHAMRSVTVTNGSANGVSTLGIPLSGPNADDFSLADRGTCVNPTPAGGSCEMTFRFAPATAGERVAIAQATPASQIDPATVVLAGRGITLPGPPILPDVTAPKVTLKGLPGTIKLKTLRRRGLAFIEGGDEPAAFDNQLFTTARRATVQRGRITTARAFNLVLAQRSLPLAGGRRTVRLKPSRKLLGNAKRFKLRLAVIAKDAAGNARQTTRTVRVR